LVDRFGERPFLFAGLLLQAIGLGWIALIAALPARLGAGALVPAPEGGR
jgi:hypothetical protein